MREIVLAAEEFSHLSEAVLKAGGCLRFEAHGTSMAPFLRNNDVITVRPAEATDLVPGTVILCRSASAPLLAHRIVHGLEVRNPDNCLLLIRGDACLGGDEVINKDSVLGVVSHVERGSRQFQVDGGPWMLLGKMIAHQKIFLPWIRTFLKFPRHVCSILLRSLQGRKTFRHAMHEILSPRVQYRVRRRVSPHVTFPHFPNGPDSQELTFGARPGGLCSPFRKSCLISAMLGNRKIGAVELVGSLERSHGRMEWWLVDLRVWPLARGGGIGEQLVRRAVKVAKGEGAPEVNVLVKEDNYPALNLYRKLSFRVTSRAAHSVPMATALPNGNGEFHKMSLVLE